MEYHKMMSFFLKGKLSVTTYINNSPVLLQCGLDLDYEFSDSIFFFQIYGSNTLLKYKFFSIIWLIWFMLLDKRQLLKILDSSP